MSEPVGADIESLCSKCGDVWHVVVAKVGEKIAKVQCKQCGGFHRHRPPGGPAPKVPKHKDEPRTAARAPGAPRRAAAPAEPPAPSIQPDLTRPVRSYRPAESYATGERIQHPTFGMGVVQSAPAPGVMQVMFPSGPRNMAQAKAASTLERPPVRTGVAEGGDDEANK